MGAAPIPDDIKMLTLISMEPIKSLSSSAASP